jgi:hypothetical protein
MMPVTLCVPPHPGELCAPVRFELTETSTVLELTARHRVTAVESDADGGGVLVCVDITDPELSRPVHVRFDLVDVDTEVGARCVRLAELEYGGARVAVVGTYLGVVSEEN